MLASHEQAGSFLGKPVPERLAGRPETPEETRDEAPAAEEGPRPPADWEMLMALLAGQKRHDEVLQAGLEYVKHRDTAHAHFLVAKAHEGLEQRDRAEAEVRLALAKEPDNLEATLGLTALLLKQSARDGALKKPVGY